MKETPTSLILKESLSVDWNSRSRCVVRSVGGCCSRV